MKDGGGRPGDGFEQRMEAAVWAVAGAGALAFLALRGWRAGLSAGLGAGLGLANFYWLRGGVAALVQAMLPAAPPGDGAASAPAPGFGMLRLGGRFALLAGGLYAIFISHLLPFAPALWGLFVVPLGVLTAISLAALGALLQRRDA